MVPRRAISCCLSISTVTCSPILRYSASAISNTAVRAAQDVVFVNRVAVARSTRARSNMDIQATRDSPPTPPRVTDRQATRGTPTPDPRPLRRQATQDSPLTPVFRAMDTRARRPILRTPVPDTGMPSQAIPAIVLQRTGRLGPSTRSSLLAEFWPDTKSSLPYLAGGVIAE